MLGPVAFLGSDPAMAARGALRPLPVGLACDGFSNAVALGPPPGLAEPTTILLRNLAGECDKSSVFKELDRIKLQARVDFVHVPIDYKAKFCRGFAFINFTSSDDAEQARTQWHGLQSYGGYPCSSGGLNVVWARGQGFNSCILLHNKRNKTCRDSTLKPWVRPDKEADGDKLRGQESLIRIQRRLRLVGVRIHVDSAPNFEVEASR